MNEVLNKGKPKQTSSVDKQPRPKSDVSCQRQPEGADAATAKSSKAESRQGAYQHIALLVISLTPGGVGRVVLNLAGFFAKRGYRVDLLAVRKEGEYLAQVPAGVNVIELGGGRVVFSVPRLVHYLRSQQPDVLVSSVTRANLAAVWARSVARVKTRIIVIEHTALSVDIPGSNRWRERLLPRLIRLSYPAADAVVAVSQGVADDLASLTGLHRNKIDVIYNPVVSKRLTEMARIEPKHPWFSGVGPPIILAAGRLTAQKDFPTLLRAFAQLRKETSARLMILGEGEARPSLEAQISDLALDDHVALPGFVENPFSHLSHVALFVLSSRWEGLPTVLIEAMACGTPVVATDCRSGPAEILKEGALGPLTPVGDAWALAQAMAAILRESPADERLRDRAHDFSAQRSALAYERLVATIQSTLQ